MKETTQNECALEDRLKSLQLNVEEHTRCLRGTNGDVGLVARVKRDEERQEFLIETVIPEMEKRILEEIERLRKEIKKDNEDTVRWRQIAEKFLYPIGMSLITAVAVAWFLLKSGLTTP